MRTCLRIACDMVYGIVCNAMSNFYVMLIYAFSTGDTPPCVGPRFVAGLAPRCDMRPWPRDNGDEIGNRMGD